MVNSNLDSQVPQKSGGGHSDPLSTFDCGDLLALIPAYSIGATDADETRLVESLLPHCPEAAIELADYLTVSDALLFSPPAVIEPMRASATATMDTAVLPTSPANGAITQRLVALPKSTPPAKQHKAYWWASRLAIVAAAAILIITNLYWWKTTSELQAQNQQLALALSNQEAKYAALGHEPAYHQELVSTQGDAAHAIAIWNTDKQIGTLYAVGLPPLDDNRVYQLWIAKPGHEVSLGVFTVDDSGTGTLVFKSSEPISDFEAIGVSIEPGSGSPHPTTPMGILGKIMS